MKLIYILILLASVMPRYALSEGRHEEVKIQQKNVHINDSLFSADIEIELANSYLRTNEMIVLIPRLESLENENSYIFKPLVFAGKKRTKVIKRSDRLSGQMLEKQLVKSDVEFRFFVRLSAPAASWMNNARLVFLEEHTGCAACAIATDQYVVALPRLEPYIPEYRLSYIVPEVEAVKERSLKYTAQFNYKPGRSELLPEFSNNAASLEEVKKVIHEVRSDKNLTVNTVSIAGYASPEGNYESNQLLSEKRAKSFADYLQRYYDIPQALLQVDWKGEDWEGLRELVELSELQDRDHILSVLDEKEIGERKKKLTVLSGGETYRLLLNEYYPSLRRNELTLNFVVKPFNVEEAKEIFKTRPQYLSLNELYLLANTYSQNSDEFKDVFDVASRLYPEDQTANLNAAAVELENGLIDRAIERLENMNTPEAWNNLGVAYAKKGDIQKAKDYLDKAANAGLKNALINLSEWQKSTK